MIEVRIQIEDIDYNTTFDAMYPILKEAILKDRPDLAKSVFVNSSLLQRSIKGIFAVVPQTTKDGWLCSAVNSHAADAAGYLENLAMQQGASIRISSIEAVRK